MLYLSRFLSQSISWKSIKAKFLFNLWSQHPFAKMLASQLLNTCPTNSKIRTFIIAFITASHMTPSFTRLIWPKSSKRFLNLWINITFHLRLWIPSGLFYFQSFQAEFLNIFIGCYVFYKQLAGRSQYTDYLIQESLIGRFLVLLI
jgi:hypothetical protein